MTIETWYVLEDGDAGDPREIVRGADGMLRHKDGRAVAYAKHGPRSRSVDPNALREKAKPQPDEPVAPKLMTPNEVRELIGIDPVPGDTDKPVIEVPDPVPAPKDEHHEPPRRHYRRRDVRAED